MKRRLILFVVSLVIVAVIAYQYLYKDHRTISDEKPTYSLKTPQLYQSFAQDEVKANKDYLNQTIEVRGKITSIDTNSQSIVLDEKLNAIFERAIDNTYVVNDSITIKGRLVGYDSLLEEIQMDQCAKSKN